MRLRVAFAVINSAHNDFSGFATHWQARRYTPPNRVRYPTDWLFASSCSPPRFTATQLLSATKVITFLWRGLPPRRLRAFTDAPMRFTLLTP